MKLVVGATGTNGREIVRRLAGSGVAVRALVRRLDKGAELQAPNVSLAAGDLDDPASLDSALSGVDRALFVAAVDERYVGWFRNFVAAAQRAGAPHVVKFSALGADPDSPSVLLRQHGETDRMLADSVLRYTILRPNSFHQNMLWSAGTIKNQGAFYLPLKEGCQSLVDVRDIAAVALKALTDEGHAGQTYELTGPESLSYHDVAAILTRVLGKPVRYVDVPPEAARESMIQAGSPEWNARAVVELLVTFATGSAARRTDVIERLTGHRPISFEQFATDHAAAFR